MWQLLQSGCEVGDGRGGPWAPAALAGVTIEAPEKLRPTAWQVAHWFTEFTAEWSIVHVWKPLGTTVLLWQIPQSPVIAMWVKDALYPRGLAGVPVLSSPTIPVPIVLVKAALVAPWHVAQVLLTVECPDAIDQFWKPPMLVLVWQTEQSPLVVM
jgi:hypothetical protein